jgi:hypothetical protein
MRSILPIAIVFITGCARYEFDLTHPPNLALHIGKTEETVTVDPLEYRLVTYDNALVMRIFNHTAEPITLEGTRSYAIPPIGQSHPLRSQTIAPNAFIKLILPPPRPYSSRSGPVFGIGIGVSSGGYPGRYGYGSVYDDWPSNATYYDENDTTYWDWPGEGETRLTLVFVRQGGQTFQHEFAFGRKKM